MSKKTKGSSAKKSNIKKAAKPVKKSPAKKTAVKKPVANKKVIAKKTAPVKSSAKKVIAKKAVKPVKSASKPKVIQKKLVKKSAPAPKKVVVKKISAKAQPKKIEKPVKPVILKKAEAKTVTPVATVKKEEKVTAAAAKKQATEKPVNGEVLAITNTIPKPQVASISASKIASISSSITNPVKKMDSYSIKSEKEPSGKYEIEIVVRSSPEMLYEFLSAPSGLSEWFCDDVNIRNGIYTFIWEGQLQQARLLKTIDDHLVRFQWVDKVDGSYFEFKIQRDDLTNDISLIITDFADSVSERESSKLLWQSQVEKLLHIMGSI